MQRSLKKTIIFLAFLIIILGILYFIFSLIFKPHCNDGVKNGDEVGVDCGGSCSNVCESMPDLKPLEIGKPYVIGTEEENRFDVVAEIKNPNAEYGFSKIDYEVDLTKDGRGVGKEQGSTYLFPGEQAYIIEIEVGATAIPDGVEVKVLDKKVVEYKEAKIPELDVLNQAYRYGSGPDFFFETTFQVANRDNIKFSKVDLETVVVGSDGEIIAINKGNLNDVRAGETRDFRFFWPDAFRGSAAKVITKARSNIFER